MTTHPSLVVRCRGLLWFSASNSQSLLRNGPRECAASGRNCCSSDANLKHFTASDHRSHPPHDETKSAARSLHLSHRNSGLPEFRTYNGPKSETSDFGWERSTREACRVSYGHIEGYDLPGPTLANRPMKYHKILAQCPTEMSAQGYKRTFAVNCHVRFTPESGHRRRGRACPLSANSGHSQAYSRD